MNVYGREELTDMRERLQGMLAGMAAGTEPMAPSLIIEALDLCLFHLIKIGNAHENTP